MTGSTKKSLLETYLNLRPSLVRFVKAKFRDENIAEDIVQEIYLKLERMPDHLVVGNLEAYLFKMANNLTIDFKKSLGRRRNRDHSWIETHSYKISNEPVYDQPAADQLIESSQKITHLKMLIEELPPQCKKVFIAHKIEELPHKEIAARMGISKSAIEKHIARAMKHLTLRLSEDE